MTRVLRAYVSGALTGLVRTDAHDLYEAAAEVLEASGFTPYLPHRATDPVDHAAIPADAVYQRDRTEVVRSDLVLAFVGRPSLGVGMELELAAAALVPILLLIPRGTQVSRMALGGAGRVLGVLAFDNAADLRTTLAAALPAVAGEVRQQERTPLPDIGSTLRRLRLAAGMTHDQVGRHLGVATGYVELVEAAAALVSNPSLAFLAGAARLFGLSLDELIVPPSGAGRVLASLRLYAVGRALAYSEYTELERYALEITPGRISATFDWDRVREEHALARAGLTQLELLTDAT